MKIIGAGLTGLLAANILRNYEPHVVEARESLPHNHGGVLRFPSPRVYSGMSVRSTHSPNLSREIFASSGLTIPPCGVPLSVG